MSWSFVDKILFINLDESKERLEHMNTHVLPRLPSDKILRFPAIRAQSGAIGCSMSHIECLRMAIDNGWESVLIMEDDSMWNRYEEGYKILEKLASEDYDVIFLGGSVPKLNPATYRLYRAQCLVAYLVHRDYYQTLLENFTEGLDLFRQYPSHPNRYAIDMYCQRLQSRDRWFIVDPVLIYQRPFYSNIEKRYVDYRHMFHL